MFQVCDLGIRASGFRIGNSDFEFRASGFGMPSEHSTRIARPGVPFQVSGIGFEVSGFGLRAWDFGFRASEFRSRDSDFGFRASGFGIRDSGSEVTGAREGLAPDKVLGEPERRAELAHLLSGLGFRVWGLGFER